jgi:hypothetical protein
LIFGVDFNDTPDSKVFHMLTNDRSSNLPFLDSKSISKFGTHGPAMTFTGWSIQDNMLIDYVLVNKGQAHHPR